VAAWQRVVIGGMILISVAVAVCGLFLLARYRAAAGPRGAVPERWPTDSRLARNPERPVLVVFVHPGCSCTRATLDELAEIADQVGGGCALAVVVADDVPHPASSEIAVRARAIPGVRVVIDRDRAEARRFGALTSGHAVLFGRDGRRLFSGGITDARGRTGDSIGRAQIVARLRGEPAVDATPVFGCELGKPAEDTP